MEKQKEKTGCGRLALYFIIFEVVLGIISFLLESAIPGITDFIWIILLAGVALFFVIGGALSDIF